ncbi:peptidase S28 [Hymenopellis radicata]|nr:peptidase S28 [Hymenopellis radicata]
MLWTSLLLSSSAFVSGIYAYQPGIHRRLLDTRDIPNPEKYNTTYWFDQLIDHANPSLGTFKQRYFFSGEFYQPGGPILLENVGEQNADGNANDSIIDLVAQATTSASIALEHRFFGQSNPYPDLSEESLQYLTLQQNIDDMVYLAQNIVLPMEGGDSVGPDKAPWILFGGSYPGKNTELLLRPEIFYAGYASSAVVEAIEDFWQYGDAVRTRMPANCSSDFQAVISHVDEVFSSDDDLAIQALKENFGMGNVTYVDDVANTLSQPMGLWQELQQYRGPNQPFYEFCDYLEVCEVDGKNTSAPESGWGLDHALEAFGSWMREQNPLISDADISTHDDTLPQYRNISVDNGARSWSWMVCNEFGWFQTGTPEGHPTIVSRFVDLEYSKRSVCQMFFPKTFGDKPMSAYPAVDATNTKFGGWNVHVDRVFFANGLNDPWIDATVSSRLIDFQSTSLTPVLLGKGSHTADMIIENAEVEPTIAYVQEQAVAYMLAWLADWTPQI